MSFRYALQLFVAYFAIFSSSVSAGIEQFDSNGVSIRYLMRGKGEPMILLHGATGSIDYFTEKHFRFYEDIGMMVVAMEFRGHGKSGKPHDKKKYGQEMVRDVVRLLDHLNIQKAHISGGSLGANVGLNVAIRYPERVLSLTLEGAGRMEPRFQKCLADTAKSLAAGKGVEPLAKYMIPKELPPKVIAQISDDILKGQDRQAFQALTAAAYELVIPDELFEGNQVPVFVVIGDNDPFRAGVDELRRVMPQAEVLIQKNADHSTELSPEAKNAIRRFLKATISN